MPQLPGWLMAIQVSRLKPEIREKHWPFRTSATTSCGTTGRRDGLPPSSAQDRAAIRDDLARVAAGECDPETCRRVDWILSEIRRVLGTGLSGKTGESRAGPDRRAPAGAEVEGMRLIRLCFGEIPERVSVVNRDPG